MLEQGTLYFSRSHTQMLKGKALGSIDLGLSFIHTDAATRRINIDGEHQVLHLKVRPPSTDLVTAAVINLRGNVCQMVLCQS